MSAVAGHAVQRRDDLYWLAIENLPHKYTWKDLKDLIRSEVNCGLWTEMNFRPDGRPSGLGHAKVRRRDEAFNLYSALSYERRVCSETSAAYLTNIFVEHRKLVVHLFDITVGAGDPIFLKCNCGDTYQSHLQDYYLNIRRIHTDTQLNALNSMVSTLEAQSPTYVNPPINPIPNTLTIFPQQNQQQTPPVQDFARIAQQMADFSLDSRNPAYMQNFFHLQQAQAQAYHSEQHQLRSRLQNRQFQQDQHLIRNEQSIETNTNKDYIRTESRGVFISNLKFTARKADVENVFRRAGEIVKIDVPRGARKNKSKGNAMIQYASATEANRAVEMFNGYLFMGLSLAVRLDKDQTPIPTASATASDSMSTAAINARRSVRTNGQPIIVDGSQVSRKNSLFSS